MANSAKTLDALMSNAAKQRQKSGPIRAQREAGPGLRAPRAAQGLTGKVGSGSSTRASSGSSARPAPRAGQEHRPEQTTSPAASVLDQHGLGGFFGDAAHRVPAQRPPRKPDARQGSGSKQWKGKSRASHAVGPKTSESYDGIDMDWASQEDHHPGEELGARNGPADSNAASSFSLREGTRQHTSRHNGVSDGSSFGSDSSFHSPLRARSERASTQDDPQLLAAKARMQALLSTIPSESSAGSGVARSSDSVPTPASPTTLSSKRASFGRDAATFLKTLETPVDDNGAPISHLGESLQTQPDFNVAPKHSIESEALTSDEPVLPKPRRGRNGELYQPRALAKEEAFQWAKRKGIDLLSRSELSAKTLEERIARDDRLAPFAKAAVAELQRLGFQSNERYAAVRARTRLATRSRKIVERELLDQDISVEHIASAMEAALLSWDVDSDTELLARAFARRFGPREPLNNAARDKQTRWFMSRGYGYDQLKTVWSMARRGELDVWAVSDQFSSALLDPEAPNASEVFALEASARTPSTLENIEPEAKDRTRSSLRHTRQLEPLDAVALAQLGAARERKFGEDAPATPAQKEKEKRWLTLRGATHEQIQELWSDAANNAALREPALSSEANSGFLSATSGLEGEEGPSNTLRRMGSGKMTDFETFYSAWSRKFGSQPTSDKERARQSGWAARQGASFSWIKEAWIRLGEELDAQS